MAETKKNSPLKTFIQFILFLAVGLSILYFVYSNQEAAYQAECAFKLDYDCEGKCEHDSLLNKLIVDFGSSSPFWLFLVCLAFMLSNVSRALRWKLLIGQLEDGRYNIKWYNAFWATMVGYLVNLALPRAGELAKPATLAQYEKLPLDKLLGTIVTDRIMDVVMLLLIIGLTFLLQFEQLYNFLMGKTKAELICAKELPIVEASDNSWLLWLLGGGVVAGLLALVLGLIFRKQLMQLSIAQKVWEMALNFWAGIKTVFSLRRQKLFWFMFHSVVIWLMYFLMTYLCFFAFGPTAHLGLMAGLLVFVFGAFGIVIPSPGGMGTYQIAVTAGLVIYGVGRADAFAFSNICFFTINLFCNIGFGLLGYMLLPLLNKNYQPSWTKENN
ncbi:lysylphosphatidylglycerol synthase transmembrane domain-containing protein [Saprospira sp. CCB-QB6]|uniref:lysylphosphatidylglycerol synthase transmembrane domain-containing protein n=1 Tax=Saprospira sp. CCB-QB6 TaxID=3023936 RepID=UPI00234AA575|nr:lysylphosphatidylglycerol synthase transmembrane domain-containing protein [Saprospira sp. CCB-QB6]WCL81926.1 lysylphosphatidylglycerol synthase transmembrane domain-containing protein [Saprospira sp. CCB-QB6]